jgi:TusA-related sulfurtransferase
MGTSLRIKPTQPAPAVAAAVEAPAASPPSDDREADFRGVLCPLNYVKTKMLLAAMKTGSVLAVLLDEAGSRNVPVSVEKDGHEVLAIEQEQEHWRVRIRKGR